MTQVASLGWTDVDSLASWLRRNVHGDVLVPVDPDTKAPLVRHGDGSWTWAAFERYRLAHPAHASFGIATQTLCVVDVDRESLIAPLRERFPALDSTIRADTRRGAHFFFTRSALCDADGFYDSRAPKMSGVDFKTRASSGTGGIVVIAPSAGKRWRGVPPWISFVDRAPPEIPEDLLRAVASPRFPPRSISFACAEGELVSRHASRHASRAAYVEVYRGSDHHQRTGGFRDTEVDGSTWSNIDASGAKPAASTVTTLVPVTTFRAKTVASAVDALDLGVSVTAFCRDDDANDADVDDDASFEDEVSDALEFLRFLCAPSGRLADVEKATREMLALRRIDPEAHRAACEDRCFVGSTGNVDLLDVRDIARDTTGSRCDFVALDLGERELCLAIPGRGDHANHAARGVSTETSRALVDEPADAVAGSLPPCVLDWMRRFAGRLVVAGGFVTGVVARGVDPGSDIDLFVVANTADEANAIAASVLSDPRVTDARYTGCALTMTVAECALAVQLVTFLMPSVSEVVAGFDFDPSRALATFDVRDASASGRLRVLCTRTWLRAVRTRTFRVDADGWSATSTLRISKYCAKGFRAYVPGLDRGKASMRLDVYEEWMPRVDAGGVRAATRAVRDAVRVHEQRGGGAPGRSLRGDISGSRGSRLRVRILRRQKFRRVNRLAGSAIADDPGASSLFLAEWLARFNWTDRDRLARHVADDRSMRWYSHTALCAAARCAHVCDYDSLVGASRGPVRTLVDRATRLFELIRRSVAGSRSAIEGGRRGLPSQEPDAARVRSSSDVEGLVSLIGWRTFAPERRLRAVHAIDCDFAEWCTSH